MTILQSWDSFSTFLPKEKEIENKEEKGDKVFKKSRNDNQDQEDDVADDDDQGKLYKRNWSPAFTAEATEKSV